MTKGRWSLQAMLAAGTALVAAPALAGDLPTGGTVRHGTVDIATPSAGHMALRQSTDRAIVAWDDFSIGAGARVDIAQPSRGAAMLNRVTGGTPSSIAGRLSANGQVYLVNPNGIAIGATGRVDAGAFVASTLDISDADFVAGRTRFTGSGRSAPVRNAGAIDVGRGGYAALIGGRVENAGTISVPLGRIGLASGEAVTLDLSGDGFLSVAVPSETSGSGALIEQSGRLAADGGRVEIKAATARHLARNAINLSGVVEARTVSGRSGAVVLGGGAGGDVRISGRIAASAAVPASSPVPRPRPEAGGTIDVTGARVGLFGADIDVSGTGGGGRARIGGGLQGGGTLQHAEVLVVDDATRISADAGTTGDGGRVILWSDVATLYDGRISARGGAESGDGGFAEVSGKRHLSFTGRADLTAPMGETGTLLLDPFDVVITVQNPTNMNQVASGTIEFHPVTSPSILNVQTLTTALGSANVRVTTGSIGDGNAQDGDITVAAPITWSGGNELTLDAVDDIFINALISAPAGSLRLNAGSSATASGAIDVGSFILDAGDWVQQGRALAAFDADDFSIGSGATFLRVTGGDGSTGNPYLIGDVYGLQGAGGFLSDSFALTGDINAIGTANWNVVGGSASGFDPIGSANAEAAFEGTFDGRGFTISNLFVDASDAGLFGFAEGATITDLRLASADVIGAFEAGALVGLASDTTIERVIVDSASSVTGSRAVGGLVGTMSGGEIRHSRSGASVSAEGDSWVGGLVGQNLDGRINRSFATGDVDISGFFFGSPNAAIGGLVGYNDGTVVQSYAQGAVSVSGDGFVDAGGLIGANEGTVEETYATGEMSGGVSSGTLIIGGLIGSNTGTVTESFWDRESTRQSTSAGGTPLSTAQLQDTGGFIASATRRSADWDFQTVWAPPDAGIYPELYAMSPVVRVIADDAEAVYGGAMPRFTGQFFGGPGAYVFAPDGDSVGPVSGLLTSDGSTSLAPGEYRIFGTGSSVASTSGESYRLVVDEGVFTVDPAPPGPPPRERILPPDFPRPVVISALLPNVGDTVDLDLGGGGGPIAEAAAARAEAIDVAEAALASLEGIADGLDDAVRSCEGAADAAVYLGCLSAALEEYGDAVDTIALDLPPPLQEVSAIIREASRKIEATRATAAERLAGAGTDAERDQIGREAIAEAQDAIEAATVEIRSAIALIRAEEPQLAAIQVEQGNAITAALDSVGLSLERSVGL